MIYEAIMYGIKCDRCHKIYEDSESATVAVDKHGELEESAEEDGWYVDGEKHYCPNCHTIDDNDKVVLKPNIHYLFFRFKDVLRMLTVREFYFFETENHFVLRSSYCYTRLTEAMITILRDIIPNFTVEYNTPKGITGKPYEIEIIKIPKDFRHK